MKSPIAVDNVFKTMLTCAGLTEQEFGDMYSELVKNNARVDLTDKTADEATMENCLSGITWVKERLTDERWQRFGAVMSILAIVMSEAQAAAAAGQMLAEGLPK